MFDLDKHPRLKELRHVGFRFLRDPSAIIGFSLLFFFIVVAVFAPELAPPKWPDMPYQIPHEGFLPDPLPPSSTAIFGTTGGQYDIFYGIVWGTRTAFKIGLIVCLSGMVIGVLLGLIAGYYGGIVDEVLMRINDALLAIPTLILAMAILVAFGRGMDKLILALCLVHWRNYVRLTRAGILSLREQDFVQAARVMGVSNIRIMWRHILPNCIFPVLILVFLNIGSMVITASFLSFIGIGAEAGYADWGQMISLARDFIMGRPGQPFLYWYTIFFPGLAIVLFVLAWNLIGDALRDAFDPKIRRT